MRIDKPLQSSPAGGLDNGKKIALHWRATYTAYFVLRYYTLWCW